jgi:hypothetical protein
MLAEQGGMQELADANSEIAVRVAKGRERQRRRQVWRSVVAVIVIGALLLGVSIRFKNRKRVTAARAAFEAKIAGLKEAVEKTGTLPLFYPPRGPDGLPAAEPGFAYLDAATVQHLRDSEEGLLVAHTTGIRQILGEDVRIAAAWRGGRLEIRVVANHELRQTLAEQHRRTEAAIEAAGGSNLELP